MKLNLGCGKRKMNGWVNVDSQPMENPDVVLDLAAEVWPWADNSVDEVFASHMMEHILPGAPFFHFLKELYRVCCNGAQIKVILPHPSHDIFLNDPTHVQAIMPGTLAMFSKSYVESMAAKGDILTPFYRYIGVDFLIEKVHYRFGPDVDLEDPELEWKAKHLRNIIFEWQTTLTAVK
jgi:hypothetical protein